MFRDFCHRRDDAFCFLANFRMDPPSFVVGLKQATHNIERQDEGGYTFDGGGSSTGGATVLIDGFHGDAVASEKGGKGCRD
ncbi:hypothetical protein SESBI_49240 [Sesbania bispinosa]|nr:hypothetical protein SESBI_49240 [Sesbania bispinosa]